MFGLRKTLSGGDPRAHRQEIGGAWGGYTKTKDGMAAGLIAGTMVATEIGWRAVEAIAEGDMVLTFDGGLQRVREVIRGTLWRDAGHCPQSLWPLYVPAGAIGNLEDLVLVPEQTVLVESDAADMLLEDPFAPVRIDALEGFRGIERMCPQFEVDVVQLVFDEDEIIFAASGALLLCPCVKAVDLSQLLALAGSGPRYRALSGDEAALLVECLREEDDEMMNGDTHGSMADAA
ncbi:MAG: Hint domain-containing protein [Pseudomonadota bacterium]